MTSSREIEILEEINENIKRIGAVITTQGLPDEKKILTMQKMGFNSTQISEMTGIPIPTVKAKWLKKLKK